MIAKIIEGFIKALIISLAILAVWYGLEWHQFRELQWNRQCDSVVFDLYFMVLWYLLSK